MHYKTNLLLSQSTAHGTSGLYTHISGEILGLGIVLLELHVNMTERKNSRSLLLAEYSQGTSNILTHDLDLGELRRSSSGHLRHTELSIITASN